MCVCVFLIAGSLERKMTAAADVCVCVCVCVCVGGGGGGQILYFTKINDDCLCACVQVYTVYKG